MCSTQTMWCHQLWNTSLIFLMNKQKNMTSRMKIPFTSGKQTGMNRVIITLQGNETVVPRYVLSLLPLIKVNFICNSQNHFNWDNMFIWSKGFPVSLEVTKNDTYLWDNRWQIYLFAFHLSSENRKTRSKRD